MGKIYFLLVRIKIKHMELSIIRRETTGAGQSMRFDGAISDLSAAPNQYNESETITKFEIMDGAPVRGTSLAHLHPADEFQARRYRFVSSSAALSSRRRSETSTRSSARVTTSIWC